MERLRRLASIALTVVLVLGLAAPASGETVAEARRKREQVRNQRAAAAARLQSARASDVQLNQAVSALATQVQAQTAKVAAARQAVAAAEKALADAQARLAQTEERIRSLRAAVVDHAVDAYIRPQRETFAQFSDAKDLNEASRRRSLLDQVVASERDLLDQLKAAREDLGIERNRAEQAAATAQSRRQTVESELGALERSLAEKARLQRALDTRIREIAAEVEALAGQESAIVSLIRQREAAERASRSAAVDTGGRVSGAGLIWPVRGVVTSEYGYRWGRLHAGIDVGAPTGRPIVASKAGVVIFSGSMSGYGNCVIVDHGGGFSTLYAHQSRIAARDGQRVGQGQVLGYVGSTGRSTGPHLHFETRVNGSPRNPRNYLP